MKTFILAILFCSPILCFAQNNSPCQDESSRHFDFWVGDWDVVDTLGNTLGTNKIQLIEGGCALQEQWKGSGGSNGSSFSYFNPSDSTWNQLWLDNQGGILKLKGKIEEAGILKMRSEVGQAGINQITWTQMPNGNVSQRWDILNKDGEFVQTVFLGIYKAKQ